MSHLKLLFRKSLLHQGESCLTLFERVRNRSAFLLQSAGGGRFSFIGYDPFAKVWSRRGVTHFLKMRDFGDWKKSSSVSIFDGNPLDVLRELVQHFSFPGKSPVPFAGGAAGYFSYDFGASLNGVRQQVFDDLDLPDFSFFFTDKFFAVDEEKHELYLVALGLTDIDAERKLENMEADIQAQGGLIHAGTLGKVTSNLSQDQYIRKIRKIQHYLVDGETYQVNFSQRFSASSTKDPWALYKALVSKNPGPYCCYFDFDDFQILSSSPELLVSAFKGRVVTRPIKGTVARGKNASEDKKQIESLLASSKDAAELAMIVDLERNDLGKVCTPGSVEVVAHREVEPYARVIHTVSTVQGKLRQGQDIFDLVAAVFPGGSITGCPKKRTMEIIDELEDFRRGVYTGSAGFLGFDGHGEMNILIRTMLVHGQKLFFQTGGGIVFDSDPQLEYEESLQKAQALFDALGAS